MNILIIGEDENFREIKDKFGDTHEYNFTEGINDQRPGHFDVIFDFLIDEDPERFDSYLSGSRDSTIFLNTVKISLAQLVYTYGRPTGNFFGFNGLPSFVNRDLLELSSLEDNRSEIREICEKLDTNYQCVADRVGMVTPRIVFMIINEAFYTVQEGTASRDDIDLGMKLGTNYPYGPFEWAKKIGIHHVYETLEAIYEDTKDERYKICPLLKKEYMLGGSNFG